MQIYNLPDIGEVHILKRANAQNIRITLSSNGKIKVTIPKWVPYQAGVAFAKSKQQWIIENYKPTSTLRNGMAIGKFHHLYFKQDSSVTGVSTRTKGSEIWVTFPDKFKLEERKVQDAAARIATKALRNQAENLLPKRLHDLANKYGFEYKSVTVRQLKARWGSCDHNKEITLNLFLMMLPWDLIDYVLLHELTHTKALHHGQEFWEIFDSVLPGAKQKRKELKKYQPNF